MFRVISGYIVSELFLNNVKQILIENGMDTRTFISSACRDGGNNLVYEILIENQKVLAKQYYRSSTDQRDRLETEWSFLGYARKVSPGNVPAPIAIDRNAGIGIYEFVEGQKLSTDELTEAHIDAAAQFFNALNDRHDLGLADNLPSASEACFSIREHIEMVDNRISRLSAIEAVDDLDIEAISLMNEVKYVWQDVREEIEKSSAALHAGINGVLPLTQRCVSPSDFGFHNALIKARGEVCFIDFEYAGWDDPAKMVTDFFCQPQVPVPSICFDRFLSMAMASFDDAEELKVRARLLWPVQRIKWICIILNIFLPDAAKRRVFASPDAASETRRRLQIDKARVALQTLEI